MSAVQPTCAGKMAYDDGPAARSALRAILERRRPDARRDKTRPKRKNLRAYRCDVCEHWHLGNAPGRGKQ